MSAAILDQGSAPTTDSARQRRYFLIGATITVGAVGAGFGTWPFIASWRPSAKARALGGPVKVRIDRVEPGAQITTSWRGRPVWILRRTPEMLGRLDHPHWREMLRDPDSEVRDQQPDYARNGYRSLRPELLVVVALCTHLGCIPTFRPEVGATDLGGDWMGGYFCQCHGSRFDFAGRVMKGVPAPSNLVVPPYRYLDADTIEIGVDTGSA